VTPKAREHRFRRLKEMGCLCCLMQDKHFHCGPIEIHHLNGGGQAGQKRRGDEFTIPLGKWHHQGQRLEGYLRVEMERIYGPSLKSSRAFRERFGTDDGLLAYANERIANADALARGAA
jgi:hypothetical protein